MKRDSRKVISLYMRTSVLEEIDNVARELGLSRSRVIELAVAMFLSEVRREGVFPQILRASKIFQG